MRWGAVSTNLVEPCDAAAGRGSAAVGEATDAPPGAAADLGADPGADPGAVPAD